MKTLKTAYLWPTVTTMKPSEARSQAKVEKKARLAAMPWDIITVPSFSSNFLGKAFQFAGILIFSEN